MSDSNLGNTQEWKDIVNSLKDIASESKKADAAVEKLGDGVKEALQVLQKLGIIKDAIKPTKDAIEAATQAFNEFNIESSNSTETLEQYIKSNKDLIKYLKSIVNESKTVASEQEQVAKAQQKSNKNTKKSVQLNKELDAQLQKVIESLEKIKKAAQGDALKVNINNAGFQTVLNEMYRAVRNFQKRAGNKGKNFFDQFIGSKEDNQETVDKTIAQAKDLVKELGKVFDNSFTDTMQKRITTAIKQGIKDGIKEGTNLAFDSSLFGQMYGKLSQYQKGALMEAMRGIEDPTRVKSARINANAKVRIAKANAQSRADVRYADRRAEIETTAALAPAEFQAQQQAKTREANAKASIAEEKLQRTQQAEDQRRAQRERWYADEKRFREELEQYDGRELTTLDKKERKYSALVEQYKRIYRQAMNNKGNEDAHLRTLQQLQEVGRQYAVEVYKASKGYDEINKRAQTLHKRLSAIASFFQRSSALMGSVSSIFSTIRSQATSLFSNLTNSVRRFTGYLRNALTSAISSGVDQFKKVESAQIGFEAFFGADRVDDIMQAVRAEALKAPFVSTGDLADYVRQLAPVANGNASLAINAALGALKTIQYSGGEATEMEYVVKNIRDVIAKGKATAIDIRQFNRAMPGLEQALKKAGIEGYINDEGQLEITTENVGKVLDMFAHLNTDADSPVKDIFDKMLNTMEGLQDVFEERKATTVESIFRNSGVFDLIKGILSNFNDDGPWNKMEKFFTGILKNVVDWIKSVDWERVGNNLKNGFERISKAAKNSLVSRILPKLKELLGVEGEFNMDTIFDTIWTLVEKFIDGMTSGIEQALGFANTLKQLIGNDNFETIAQAIGWLVSPMGRIMSTMLNLARDTLSGFSRMFATLDSITQWGYKSRLSRIEQAAGKFADQYTSRDVLGRMTLNKGAGLYGDTLVSGGGMVQKGVYSRLRNSAGKFASWDSLSMGEKISNVGFWNYIKGGAQKAGEALKDFGAKALKAAAAAGTIYSIGEISSSVVKQLNLFGDNTETIANTIKFAATTIAGAVAGATFGDIAGGLVGAFAAAALAAVGLYNDWKTEHDKKIAEEKEKAHNEVTNSLSDTLVKNMQNQGVQIDAGSNAGAYAIEKMKQYLDTFDDPMMADFNEAEKVLLDALRFKKTAEGLAEYAKSSEYEAIGGRTIDFKTDTDARDRLASLISYHRLLGDDYTYGTAEQIVNDWQSSGHATTYEQLEALERRNVEIGDSLAKTTTDYIGKIQNNTAEMQKLVEAVRENTKTLNIHNNDVKNPVQALAGWEEATDKSLYTTDGKTYHIADVLDFLNQQIRGIQEDFQHGWTDEEKKTMMAEYANIWSDIYKDYTQNPDFSPAKWFNYMHMNYGGSGFDDFYNSHGIEGDSNAYIKAYNANGGTLVEDVAQWFSAWTKLYNFHTILDPEEMYSQSWKDYSDATKLTDDEKKKIQDLNAEYSKQAMKEFWDLVRSGMSVNDAQLQIREKYGDNNKKENPSFWDILWNALTIFGNHGGFIRPVYRATGGLGVDTVPAMLQPGEFVVRRSSVSQAGLSTMFALNRGDMAAAARNLGARFSGNYNNSRNWSSVTNNNQKTQTNYIKVMNRNTSSRLNSYYGLANRIALS